MRLSLIALLVAGAFAETVALEKRATAWPTRLFAPYCDVLLWPTFDTAASGAKTGAYYYHLAFVTANSAGEPAWGSSVGMDQNWYGEMLTKLRNAGGDAIISFGGAIGTDLALYWTDVNTIAAKYQQVITQYGLSRVDFDVEGHAAEDSASIDRRNKAIVILKRNNPGLHVSYTLAVFPGGLATSGLNIIKNAVSNGAKIDMINIMAMDYGSGVAPNGATGMGGYAISAAQGTYQQAQNAGLTNIKIGITPMIGKNDVQGEVFRVEDARLLLTFSLANAWVGMISYWSINRDVFNLSGALYQSSQITQNNLDFANILVKFQSSAPTTPVVVTPPATTVPVASGGNMGYVWGKNVFAPYCDVTWNTPFDLVAMAGKSGTARFTLAFIIADSNGKPAWGGYIPLSNNHYWTQISKLRMFGGDVIISFGGAGGTELALVTTNVRTLQGYYQNVLDAYSVSWLDFDVEGGALGNRASIDRRNQAIRALQVAQPALRISYTLPVEPYGLTNDGVYLLESAVKYGVRVDVLNIMAMDYSPSLATNGQNDMAKYAISAATATYRQLQAANLKATTVGITVMIGQNDVLSQVFQIADATTLVKWAKQQTWVSLLSYWSVNRDNSRRSTELYRSTNVQQNDFQYAKAFLQYEN